MLSIEVGCVHRLLGFTQILNCFLFYFERAIKVHNPTFQRPRQTSDQYKLSGKKIVLVFDIY